jgi:hypothetical protein
MEFGLTALRFEVLLMLLGNMSFRKLARSIAANDLLADFCGVRTLEGIHGVSKSGFATKKLLQCFSNKMFTIRFSPVIRVNSASV